MMRVKSTDTIVLLNGDVENAPAAQEGPKE